MRSWHLTSTLLAIALAACSASDGGGALAPGADVDAASPADVGGGKEDGPSTPDAGPDGGASMEPTSSCTDLSPGDAFTCGEQVGWGKCDEPWMAGYCDRS